MLLHYMGIRKEEGEATLPFFMILNETSIRLARRRGLSVAILGDYCAPARGTMENVRPEGHIMPPEGCIMPPEGCRRPGAGRSNHIII